jgi:Uri superfamily endonuclease
MTHGTRDKKRMHSTRFEQNQLPSDPGTYVLLLWLKKSKPIVIGKLGTIDFTPGYYAYVGSAMGPGGLAARIRRHLKINKKAHWHIDYLRPAVRIDGLFIATGRRIKEHAWAERLAGAPISGRAINGFGCTDCRCVSHLYQLPSPAETSVIAQQLNARWINPNAA